ncbi:tetraspanin 35 [Gouania willdenowi]|uniref:Tetraspanin n=1 Tax=Gouania willdenowi TaxID=441366 RepID=A0A8C5DKS9_GOUWI|nr:tetraspanin-1-like [Gouania willdenowi]
MGCLQFLKVIMVVFNGIIFLSGAAIMGVGIWVKVDFGSLLALLEGAPSELSQLVNVAYLLIAVGALLIIIGFLGCCGALKESQCMLLLFFIIILIIVVAEISAGIVIFVFRPLLDTLLNEFGVAAVKNIQTDYGRNTISTGLWNVTMITLKCCGFYNSTDFVGSPYYNDHGMKFPPYCCPGENPCGLTEADNDMVTGCFLKLHDIIDNNVVVIGAVALGIAALEICAMVVSMILYHRVQSNSA